MPCGSYRRPARQGRRDDSREVCMSSMNAQDPESFGTKGKVRLLQRRPRTRASLRSRVPAEKLRMGVYLIPSLFTAGNLICGFFSLLSTFNGNYLHATYFIIIA